jgi:hypothetical protein
MNLTISSDGVLLRQDATTQTPRSNPDPVFMTDKEIKNLTDRVNQQVRTSVANAQGQAEGGVVVAPPVTPEPNRMITVRGPDGRTTMIGVPPGLGRDVIPQQVVDISIAFFLTMAAIIIGLPLARAFARRMDRRGSGPQVPTDLSNQIGQLNQAVDAIALEVERISEGQRFTTRLLSEQRDSARQSLPTSAPR